MVMYFGQGGRAEYHTKKDIGQDDGMSDVTITPVKPVCKLTGGDGNVYAIIGSVKACLRHAGQRDKAEEFAGKALHSESYDAVIALAMEYVTVE